MSVQSLKTEEIAGTNGISPALLLGKHDNSFSCTPSLGSSIAILKEYTLTSPLFIYIKINLGSVSKFVQQEILRQ
jgi:hypothetical protein